MRKYAQKFDWFAFSAMGVSALLAAIVPTEAQELDFSGKSIRVIVNFPAGGSSDILMRQIAPAIGAALPGAPTLVVENRPGAGGLIGSNYLYNGVKPDGLNWGLLTGIAPLGLVGNPRAKYDPAKFAWLGAFPQTQVLVVRSELKLDAPRDLNRPDIRIVHASTGPNSSGTILSKLFYEMAKTNVQFISGYRGQADTDIALQKGEVNAADMGITIFLAHAKRMRDGKVLSGFLQRGMYNVDGSFHRHRLLSDIPTVAEALDAVNPGAKQTTKYRAYSIVTGTFGVQFGLVLPPGADAKLVATLRKGVSQALQDQKLRDSVSKAIGFEFDFIDGAASEALLGNLDARIRKDAEVKALLTNMFGDK